MTCSNSGIWVERIEDYEDAQRRIRYCMFKLGKVIDKKTGKERGCKLRSEKLKRKLATELIEEQQEEKDIRQEMDEGLEHHPVWADFLLHIKGIGPVYAYRLIGSYEGLSPVATISNPGQAWRLAGIGLVDGQPQGGRKKRSDPPKPAYAGYYPLRRVLGELASRIVRLGSDAGSFYRLFYDGQRRRYGDPAKEGIFDKTDEPIHQYLRAYHTMREADPAWRMTEDEATARSIKAHAASILDMKRLLISHLWACWRETHGLSVPTSYGGTLAPGHAEIPWTDAVATERTMAEYQGTATATERADRKGTATKPERSRQTRNCE